MGRTQGEACAAVVVHPQILPNASGRAGVPLGNEQGWGESGGTRLRTHPGRAGAGGNTSQTGNGGRLLLSGAH